MVLRGLVQSPVGSNSKGSAWAFYSTCCYCFAAAIAVAIAAAAVVAAAVDLVAVVATGTRIHR